jgi:hypothetical protein
MHIVPKVKDCPVYLVASCLGDGDTGGGLLYHNRERWVVLDDVSTTGLFVYGDELVRVLWASSQVAQHATIMRYFPHGLKEQFIVPGLTDTHDVLWDGEHYVAVSPTQNSVVWINRDGRIVRRYQPVQGWDCWHLNCLHFHDEVLYVTAFGRFSGPRGWAGRQREGTGVLIRLDTDEDVLTGLCCPHTPRREAGHWLVCNSSTSQLRLLPAGGFEVVRSVTLRDWLRGVAIADDFIFVGESVNRQLTTEVRGASVAILDRKTWKVMGRLALPYREVYDLVLVSSELLDGLTKSPGARSVATCPPEIPRSAVGNFAESPDVKL